VSLRRVSEIAVIAIYVVALSVSALAQDVDDGASREIFRLLNQERTQRGLPALKWDDRLANAAVEHSKLLAKHKQLSHQFSGEPALRLRYARYNIRLDRAGENVAYDSTVQGAHDGFMHSPPHRENILSPNYDAAGVGVIHSGDLYYVTQDFAHLVADISGNAAEDQVAARIQQLRAAQRQPRLERVNLAEVRKMACSMARADRLEPERGRELAGARYFVAYTMTDPQQLPGDLTKLRTGRAVDRFAVGTCFQSTPQYPNGVYWVMVVFLQGSEQAVIRGR
jgi:Cysteine-rich secretory protein family